MGQDDAPQVKDLFILIAKMNKIEIIKIERFFALYTIYSSKNEHLISIAFSVLGIPKEYFKICLVNKGVLNVRYLDENYLRDLGVRSNDVVQKINNPELDMTLAEPKVYQEALKKYLSK